MKIAVLLSGGVDSSTALMRLKDQGYTDICAYYLKIWLEDDSAFLGSCPWEEDLAFAQAVCDQAGVPLRIIPLQLEYYDKVVAYALEELKAGRTPSPDIFCNQRIKFGAFFECMAAAGSDFDKVATGHYARVDCVDGRWRLLRAPDPVKDQTYFLSQLSQEQLSKIIFPVGDVVKGQVREMARSYDIPNQDRPDSQGICFLGKIRYPDFVKHYLGEQDGPIIERETGQELGRHLGFWFHTIGQRTGLGLGNGPWYVSAKDCGRNIVYVSHGSHAEETERRDFVVGGLNWLSGTGPSLDELSTWNASGQLCLKLRHGPQLINCRLELADAEAAEATMAAPAGQSGAAASPTLLHVTMDRPDRGIAAGQFAVFYRGEECLGSGKILESDPDLLEQLWQRQADWQARQAIQAAAEQAAKRAKKQAQREKYGPKPGQAQP